MAPTCPSSVSQVPTKGQQRFFINRIFFLFSFGRHGTLTLKEACMQAPVRRLHLIWDETIETAMNLCFWLRGKDALIWYIWYRFFKSIGLFLFCFVTFWPEVLLVQTNDRYEVWCQQFTQFKQTQMWIFWHFMQFRGSNYASLSDVTIESNVGWNLQLLQCMF